MIVGATETSTVAAADTAVMAALTAAEVAPTAAKVAADAVAAEVEWDMNQRVGVFEKGSMLTQISGFRNICGKKGNDLASVYTSSLE